MKRSGASRRRWWNGCSCGWATRRSFPNGPGCAGVPWDTLFTGMTIQTNMRNLPVAFGAIAVAASLAAGVAQAQVPPDIEASLRKIGQIVDPPCTAKLYRPLMPVNDINSNVTPLYPGITI